MLTVYAAKLKVHAISPVKWNMDAFESLVVDDDTKQMVKALVTNHLVGGKTTDLMDGKGNGLVILIHGYVNQHIDSQELRSHKAQESGNWKDAYRR